METPFPAPRRSVLRVLLGVVIAMCALLGVAAPAGAWVTGVDVASWQHPGTTGSACGRPIDWFQVKGAGHSFAYIKSTESTTYTNPCFAQDWQGAASAGLYRGSYHYAKPALPLSTAQDQARYFVSRTGSMTGPQDLPGFLDLEETGGLGPADLAQWTRIFLAEVTGLTGKKPMIYVGRYFWSGQVGNPVDIGQQYRLWLPDYHCQRQDGTLLCDPDTNAYSPGGFAGWSTWTFWQTHSVGHVPGIFANSSGTQLDDVDMNRFCCDATSLASLAGSGAGGGTPFGAVENITPSDPLNVQISGSAIDPDTRNPITVHVLNGQLGVDANPVGVATVANITRNDVAAAYPGFGPNHGFKASLPLTNSTQKFCAYAINTGTGSNAFLGCAIVGSPYGYVDLVEIPSPGKVHVAGWAKDPNTAGTVQVQITSGSVSRVVTANIDRTDVGSHAYDVVLDVPGGRQQVCVTARNASGPGRDQMLPACSIQDLPTGSPYGYVDIIEGRVGEINVGGWAIDPDTANAIQVHAYVDGAGTALASNLDHGGVNDAHPGYGDGHGFSATIPASVGAHRVCLYAIEAVGNGSNTELACRRVTVRSPEPFGSIDLVRGGVRSIDVAGWVIDPDTANSVQVHVYVDGVGTALVANGNRPDLTPYYPGLGTAHGFTKSIPASPGLHQVCLYAINMVGRGSNQLLGCRSVLSMSGDPFGSIDIAARGYGLVRFAGWALDPKTSASTQVHIYINGKGVAVIANLDRPDVGAIFGVGSKRGFDYLGPQVGTGPQNVCLYAINTAPGGTNTLMGCRIL